MMNNMDYTTIEQIVNDFQYQYASKIADTGHSASGNLALNQKHILNFDGRYFTVTLQLEDYWKYLEEGTKPHWPPIDAIKQWIKVKPILPRPMQNGKLPTNEQLAFMIARKISLKGTPATHLLQQTLSEFNLVKKVYDAFLIEWKKQVTSELHK